MKIDILYLSWNRLAFTELTFGLLHRNTDWGKINRLVVYDDSSEDGTLEFLQEAGKRIPVPAFDLRVAQFRSPVTVMNDYLATSEADVFAKIDNDIALPPRWLEAMLGTMQRNQQFDLLGMEAGRTGVPGKHPKYRVESCSHIGGVGLMKTSAFKRPIASRGRFGFTEYQAYHNIPRGWIKPDLLCPQLDLIPVEPWRSLSESYIEKGWQRRWPLMEERWCSVYWDWIPREERDEPLRLADLQE